jgi:hypothetical protein
MLYSLFLNILYLLVSLDRLDLPSVDRVDESLLFCEAIVLDSAL